jgi:hypothetical protein
MTADRAGAGTVASSQAESAGGPLPSWRAGTSKQAILEFEQADSNDWTVVSINNDWATVF